VSIERAIECVGSFTSLTISSGNNQELKQPDKGKPLFFSSNWFIVFFISNTVSFVFSSTSILIFLSILTSHYKEENFLKTILVRLLGGLAALFISIAGMVLAFSATCFLIGILQQNTLDSRGYNRFGYYPNNYFCSSTFSTLG
jgi:hypothetical protein